MSESSHTYRHWTEPEIALLRDHYEGGGADAVNQVLIDHGFPPRSKPSISQRASKCGLRLHNKPKDSHGYERRVEEEPTERLRRARTGLQIAMQEAMDDLARYIERYRCIERELQRRTEEMP